MAALGSFEDLCWELAYLGTLYRGRVSRESAFSNDLDERSEETTERRGDGQKLWWRLARCQ